MPTISFINANLRIQKMQIINFANLIREIPKLIKIKWIKVNKNKKL